MKIYVRMRGGLGNQMFQYAYALALREAYPAAGIWLDSREYRRYKRRSFELTSFVLGEDTHIHSDGPLRYDLPIKFYHVYQRLYREVRGRSPFGVSESLARRGLILTGTGCPLPAGPLPEEVFLYGYFQDADVFLPVREKLRGVFSLPEAAQGGLFVSGPASGETSVAVSIRLGDDILQSGWQLCSRDHYREGIEAVRRERLVDTIYVFSDKPEQVAEEKWFDDLGLRLIFTAGLSPAEQIAVMALCRHFVISNSTFAWWGAFLGAGDDGVIAAPKLWQGNIPTDETALYLKNMILL